MKRGGPLRRKTPLRRLGPLKRPEIVSQPPPYGEERAEVQWGTGQFKPPSLKRGGFLKRSKAKVSLVERKAMEEFGRQPPSARCSMCGDGRISVFAKGTRLEAHHVVAKAKLKQVCSARGLDVATVVWDVRNRMWLCAYPCHAWHTDRVKLVPRSKVPVAAFEFAAELGVTYLIDRDYP